MSYQHTGRRTVRMVKYGLWPTNRKAPVIEYTTEITNIHHTHGDF